MFKQNVSKLILFQATSMLKKLPFSLSGLAFQFFSTFQDSRDTDIQFALNDRFLVFKSQWINKENKIICIAGHSNSQVSL